MPRKEKITQGHTMEPVRVVQKGSLSRKFTLMNGLPDVGLVGVVAGSQIVSSLGMKEVGTVESELFPPLVVLHEGVPKSPIRIYGKESLAVIIAETAIPAGAVYPLAEAIVNWASSTGADLILSIGGMAVQNRQDIESPKVFAALSDKKLSKLVNGAAEVLGEGYIVGAYALMLKRCAEIGLPAIALLTQSFYNYPDPEAAAAAVKSVNQILGLDVDTSELLRKGEEIRLRGKDVMKRTQTEMARINKSQEYDVPPLYG
jgi:uncharacterized protein